MKQQILAIVLMLTLGQTSDAASQSHRHSPRMEQTDSAQTRHDALEAYSDTTAAADVADTNDEDVYAYSSSRSLNDKDLVRMMTDNLDINDLFGMLLVLAIILTIFVLAPIAIIIAIFYFINKNRRERLRLAQMAMQNGQPIPDELLRERASAVGSGGDEYARGMRQLFLGLGLMVFLGYAAGKIGFAIGALVFCIGLGKVVIAKTQGNQSRQSDNPENWHVNNE